MSSPFSWKLAFARLLLAAACVVAAGWVFGMAPAAASVQFGSEGEAAGQLAQPHGVAVDQETGDVFVVDRGNRRVEKFSGAGVFLLGWGWGVADGATSALQTCEATCFKGLAGEGAGQLGSSADGVAVDNSLDLSRGDVYVEDSSNNRVEKFTADGEFLLTFGGEVNATTHGDVCLAGEACEAGVAGLGADEFEGLSPNAITVDSAGTVYVGDENRVQEFSEAGVLTGEIALPGSGFITALTVDASKDIYVLSTELEGVREYESSGTEVGEPRDSAELTTPESKLNTTIALGAAGELFIDVSENVGRHILEYDPAGEQVASFIDEGGALFPSSPSLGLAYSVSAKCLYVLYEGAVVLDAPPPPGPVVVANSEAAGEVLPTAVEFEAVVNREGGEGTSWHVEYGETTAYEMSTPPEELGGEPFEDQHVDIAVTGLSPLTLYHFRIVVSNAAAQVTVGPDQTFTTLPPVSIESESVSQVSSTSATLATVLNPHGRETEYRFQYGRSSSYEASLPVPDGSAGAGSVGVGESILLENLSPGTTYHYRVLAHNALGLVEGRDQTFTTQQGGGGAGLIDGRAWEMVSPSDKHGVSLEGITEEGGLIQAAEDGSALTYIAKAPVDSEPAGSRSVVNQQLLSRRERPGAWSTQDVATAHEGVAGLKAGNLSEYKQFSTDLSTGAVEPEGATPLSPLATERTPYRRETNGEYAPLVYSGNVPLGTKFGGHASKAEDFEVGSGVTFITGSPDLDHILLGSGTEALTEGFETGGHESLYEWFNGELTPVSILPGGASAAAEGGAKLGDEDKLVRNAVSRTGERVVFESATEHHLFVRDLAAEQTVRLDVAEKGAVGGAGQAVFQAANSEDSIVFFKDTARLTKDATSKSAEPDLYMCEVTEVAGDITCRLKDLTVDGNVGEAADVLGAVLGASDDGSVLYFVANGVLNNGGSPVAGATHGDCLGEAGATPARSCNLYMYDTVTGAVSIVAVLSNEDLPDWNAKGGSNLGGLTARVSPDGGFLAFMSQRPLTGFDNRDAASGAMDEEVFSYDSSSGRLVCASCDPSGERPSGLFDSGAFPGLLVDRPQLWPGATLAGSIPGWTLVEKTYALYQSRYLDNNGRLFFNSSVGLVPKDANEIEDVYEFEPVGVGGCSSETNGGRAVFVPQSAGCVGLISSGESGEESAFLDASESGDDVFFLTASKLSATDVDSAFDVYDAHVCSASAPCMSGEAIATPPACESRESCQSGPSVPPPSQFGAPASATFFGPGNPGPGAAKVSGPTRAQRLAGALRVCREKHAKSKRRACEAQARRRYGPPARKADRSARNARPSAREGGRGR